MFISPSANRYYRVRKRNTHTIMEGEPVPPSANTDEPQKSEEGGKDKLKITVVGQDGTDVEFHVKTTTKWSKIQNAYCSHRAISASSIRLFFEGRRINNDLTVSDYQLEEGDQVDAVLEQTGGGCL